MRKYNGRGLLLLICLTAAVLSGCGEEEEAAENVVKNPYAGAVSMEETPVVNYEVPQLLPNVLVDTRGYSLGGRKVAAVKGRKLPREFCLADAATGEEVYRGTVEEAVYHEDLGLYSGNVDFSDFERVGTYYLQCDIIGCSVPFEVREDLYADLFEEAYGEMTDDCRARSLALAEAVTLLEVYEWYADIFPDGDGDEVPDILRELRGWVSYQEENGVDQEEEALYAAFLAKFSYLYQRFDRTYATDCLKRASTVLGQVKEKTARDADVFFALTELYRATGRYTYRKQIIDYKSFFEDNSSFLEERSYLYAAMTYLATRQKVDVDLCENFMSSLMDRAEEISKRYTDMISPLAAKNNGPADLLKGAAELSCANYIMNNYQYTGIMEEFIHYLMGQNVESVCFYESGEDRGSYLLFFAQLTALREVNE